MKKLNENENEKINIFNFVKKNRELVIKSNRLSKNSEDSDLTLEDLNKIYDELKLIEATSKRYSEWFNKTIPKIEFIHLVICIANILILFFVILFNYKTLQNSGHNINIEFYSTTAALIPVMLIAIYFSNKDIFCNGYLSIIAELISRIIPAVTAIGICLYAIANKYSDSILLYITVSCLIQLAIFFVSTSIAPELKNKK